MPAVAEIFGEALKSYVESLEKSVSFTRSPDGGESEGEGASPKKSMPHPPGSLLSFQKLCSDIANQLSAAVPGVGLSGLSRVTANILIDSFKEEYQKCLNVPALGLTRFYQERMNKTLETCSSFQSSLTEFFQLLAIPLERASDALQEEMGKAVQEVQDSLHDHETLYRFWIEKLEEYYLSLLKSQQYTEALAKTLSSLCEYRKAREKFLLDLLQDWPIATTKEMDEIGRDLYLLKKRVRELEKKVR